MFGLCSLAMARAEEPARFHLDLHRPAPKAGDETERTIRMVSTASSTNLTRDNETVTNTLQFLELKCREKTSNWDVSNNLSKVEMVVDRFVDGDGQRTNELAKPGTRLVGTSIAGETFFESKDGILPNEASRQLEKLYSIRPRNFDEFARTELPQTVSMGESWAIPPPTNSEELTAVFGPGFTNTVKATARLVETTNLFGFNCFHLQFRITSNEFPENLRKIITSRLPMAIQGQVSLLVDLIVPFDQSQKVLMKSYLLDFSDSAEMMVDGKNVMSSRGRNTIKIISEFRPITRR
jgi:hypothetical protein